MVGLPPYIRNVQELALPTPTPGATGGVTPQKTAKVAIFEKANTHPRAWNFQSFNVFHLEMTQNYTYLKSTTGSFHLGPNRALKVRAFSESDFSTFFSVHAYVYGLFGFQMPYKN